MSSGITCRLPAAGSCNIRLKMVSKCNRVFETAGSACGWEF